MKRSLFALLAAVLPAAAVLAPTAADAAQDTRGARACATAPVSAPKGTRVESVVAVANPGGTVTPPATVPLPQSPPITDVPAWCDIVVTVTHPGAGDHTTIKISLPHDRKNWDGRFLATGGSAYLAGDLHSPQVIQAVKDGYVAAATDGASDRARSTSAAGRLPLPAR
jgi:hypothetical protein